MGSPLKHSLIRALPLWVPDAVRHYLDHTEAGLPIRVLARNANIHASTVLRQIRRFESRRDDPLVDDALRRLSKLYASSGATIFHAHQNGAGKETVSMANIAPYTELKTETTPPEKTLGDSMRVLRRMAEVGAVLALAREMEKGVVVREGPDGAPQRLAIVDRDVAQRLALMDWISCADVEARINRYQITSIGRTALKEHMAAEENRAHGFAEDQSRFSHRSTDTDTVRLRVGVFDSPLNGLARRKDRTGLPFLSRDMVAAGERLREDYELSQLSAEKKADWDKFLANELGVSADFGEPSDAKARVASALHELGPGLGDVALRACCYLEGMESLEKQMGWSARSGKIVLRIALQRLKRHYAEINGGLGPKIG